MQCPQCATALQATVYEGVPMHTCEGCGGEFMGGEELARIVKHRRERFTPQMRGQLADRKPAFGGLGTEPDRVLACPACGNTMKIANYGGDTGIFVDRCGICSGLWLDHEELEKVQIVMEQWADEAQPQIKAIAGELEKARREAADHTTGAFSGSRFAFINALINRLLDAA